MPRSVYLAAWQLTCLFSPVSSCPNLTTFSLLGLNETNIALLLPQDHKNFCFFFRSNVKMILLKLFNRLDSRKYTGSSRYFFLCLSQVTENQDEPSVSDNFHEVELLLPFLQDKYLEGVFHLAFMCNFASVHGSGSVSLLVLFFCEACSQKEVVGVLLFRGSVCSLSYLNSKEPVLQALIDVKVTSSNYASAFRKVVSPFLLCWMILSNDI